MIVDEIFENIIYPNLKAYLEEHSNYSPYVTKRLPQNSKDFPIVPVKLLPFSNIYNNLSYGEETYPFSISIEVYAVDTEDVSKRTICNEVTKWIDTYFKEKYHIIDDNCETDAYWINIDEFNNNKKLLYPEEIFRFL